MKNYLWSDLFSLIHIVKAGSFTKAAEEMGLSPSVLSKRIRRLEAELKVNLLKRNTRSISLTEAGSQYYAQAQRLNSELEQVIQTVSAAQQEPAGKLRIAAPFSFGQMHLAPALFAFGEKYPDIHIELLLGQPTTRLIEKNIDIGIFIKEVPDSRLIAKRIGTRKITLCGSSAYFERHGIPETPADLMHHNCLLYGRAKLKNQWRFKTDKETFIVDVKGNFSANSSHVLALAALHGKGIVKLPDYMVREKIQAGKLIRILDTYCPREFGIYAAYPFTRHPARNVKVLIDFLAKQFLSIDK